MGHSSITLFALTPLFDSPPLLPMLPYCTVAPTTMEREPSIITILTITLVILTGFLVLGSWFRQLFTYIWFNSTVSGVICREFWFLCTLSACINQVYTMKRKGLWTVTEATKIQVISTPDTLSMLPPSYRILVLNANKYSRCLIDMGVLHWESQAQWFWCSQICDTDTQLSNAVRRISEQLEDDVNVSSLVQWTFCFLQIISSRDQGSRKD